MRVLLFGWSGFIGQNLLSFPKFQNNELICWLRSGSDLAQIPKRQNIFVVKGIMSPRLFDGVDVVINMAGRAHHMKEDSLDPLEEYMSVNRDFAMETAKYAIEAGVKKFIHLSTVKVMGDGQVNPVSTLTEKDPPKPEDPYGISKLEAEKELLTLFSGEIGKCCIILRLPMVYGPGNKGNMLFLLRAASAAIPLPLGSAMGKRSMIYVGNLCDAIYTVAVTSNNFNNDIYFVTDGEDKTSSEIYSVISSEYNGKRGVFPFPIPLLRFAARLGDSIIKFTSLNLLINSTVIGRLFNYFRFSPEKFMETFEWTPPYSVKEGVAETVKWHKEALKKRQ